MTGGIQAMCHLLSVQDETCIDAMPVSSFAGRLALCWHPQSGKTAIYFFNPPSSPKALEQCNRNSKSPDSNAYQVCLLRTLQSHDYAKDMTGSSPASHHAVESLTRLVMQSRLEWRRQLTLCRRLTSVKVRMIPSSSSIASRFLQSCKRLI